MSARRDEDLRELLDELEDTLEALRVELETRDRRRRPVPRPPSLGEFLRFTGEYTIPTVVAMLEATIRSLDLLREFLRMADPGRRADVDDHTVQTRLDDAGRFAADRATEQFSRTLEELRRALTEADLPRESESRSLIEDIRSLSEEIEYRITEADRTRDRADRSDREDRWETGDRRREDRWGRRGGDRDVVRIDVSEEGEDDDGAESEGTKVDIEAELDSIKEEVHGADREGGEEADEADDGGDGGDGNA
ncbi:MAG: hypothetical protein ABEJ28_09095 [Salinigranum sp.]